MSEEYLGIDLFTSLFSFAAFSISKVYFFLNWRTVLSFRQGNSALNLRTDAFALNIKWCPFLIRKSPFFAVDTSLSIALLSIMLSPFASLDLSELFACFKAVVSTKKKKIHENLQRNLLDYCKNQLYGGVTTSFISNQH